MANSKAHPTDTAITKVRKKFKKAMFATPAGKCDNCGLHGLYFWKLETTFDILEDGYVEGGFWCECCGFGNAGAMLYDEMKAYWPDTHVHLPKHSS